MLNLMNQVRTVSCPFFNRRYATQSWLWLNLGGLAAGLLTGASSWAQGVPILPDRTLSQPSQVSETLTITGGTPIGGNLFHSFERFSVPAGQQAVFNPTPTTRNIITRITGVLPSAIEGGLGVKGSANLFLINPNGISFGPNARLSINGSFLASTASGVVLSDRTLFSATNPQSPSLLAINLPLGLQFGRHPGPIVQQSSLLAPGQTLALVGGDVRISGGQIFAQGGPVEIGSVQGEGQVALQPQPGGFTLAYPAALEMGAIQLSQGAEILTAGAPSGNIHIKGRSLQLTDSSRIAAFNLGGAGGSVTLNARDSVEVQGTGNYANTLQGIFDGTLSPLDLRNSIAVVNAGPGLGGNLTINTGKLQLSNGAYLGPVTGGAGPAGALTIVASRSVDLSQGVLFSGSGPGSTGDAGPLTLTTGQLRAQDGSIIASSSIGSGKGGSLGITAQSIELTGTFPEVSLRLGQRGLPAIVGSTAIVTASPTQGGSLTIATDTLVTRRGVVISVSNDTFSANSDLTIRANSVDLNQTVVSSDGLAGAAGNIAFRVQDQATLNQTTLFTTSGTSFILETGAGKGGNIDFRTGGLTLANESGFRSSTAGTGNAGDITIESRGPVVIDGASSGLFATALGQGRGGDIQVSADRLTLSHQAQLNASTNQQRGGNIDLRISNLLLLRQGSTITAQALQNGSGGNLNINAGFVAAVPQENSDIMANANQGQGGNIQITTALLTGLAFRPNLTALSDITASAKSGLNGIVQLNTADFKLNPSQVVLPSSFLNAATQITPTCSPQTAGNSFVVTGRGGLPPTPTEVLNAVGPWDEAAPSPHPRRPTARPPIVEAQGWITQPDGQIALVAEPLANGRSRSVSPGESGTLGTSLPPQPSASCRAQSVPQSTIPVDR
jgi:filamentous hemagglutinin family protein